MQQQDLTAGSFACSDLPSDFGFAQYMSPWDEQSVLRGSPLYMAPEMVCRHQYDSRVDLWSVGVILYGEYFVFTVSSDSLLMAIYFITYSGDQNVFLGT